VIDEGEIYKHIKMKKAKEKENFFIFIQTEKKIKKSSI
jgi:hypothetical protein